MDREAPPRAPHPSDDRRVSHSMLHQHLTGYGEELVRSATIICDPASVRHLSHTEDVQIEVVLHPGIPVGDPPGQFREVIRLSGIAREAPAALFEKQLDQGSTAEAVPGPLDPPCSFLRREGQELAQAGGDLDLLSDALTEAASQPLQLRSGLVS